MKIEHNNALHLTSQYAAPLRSALYCRSDEFKRYTPYWKINMTNEILIGLGGLILCGLTYFAGVRRTEKRLKHEDRDNRITSVLNKYLEFRRTNHTAGLDGLQKAGVATLHNDKEIEELIKLIIDHAEKDPIGGSREVLKNVSLKKLFDHAATHRVNFHRDKLEDIIKKI